MVSGSGGLSVRPGRRFFTMKRLFLLLAGILPAFLTFAQNGQVPRIVDEGGAGSYKAVIVSDPALPGCTVYRPSDLVAASARTTVPLVLFEGSKGNDYDRYLSEIASFGYVIVAFDPSVRPMEGLLDDARDSFRLGGLPVDTAHVAAILAHPAGTSVLPKGIGTAVCIHRVRPASDIPVLLLAGGMDARYPDVLGSFEAPGNAFIAMATYPAGPEGTFSESFGGSYASLTFQWLEWQLKGKPWSRKVFTGEECICIYSGWGIQFKNENTVID